jgi:ATP-dependent Zn protease
MRPTGRRARILVSLIEIVDFLKNPAKYRRLGGTVPRGVLLTGAPSGRASEKLVYGEATTGAERDLQQVTQGAASSMVQAPAGRI